MSDNNWRKRAVPAGMIIGLIGGMVFAVVSGANSGLSATSGFAIGAVAGGFVQPGLKTWAKFVFLAVLVGLLAWAWLA